MLQNAYLLAKIGADTAENEQQFAASLPVGRRVAIGAAPDPIPKKKKKTVLFEI